ncbi:hypothetical protein GX50_03261 [[Emmonsia] crescens]|uniref:Uncharacterized protein n=1 Tax=[Emmonsia] crescens TaxID=73230 RepID=A0A2B7ZKT7_9EURO|nr:hypothetical protein GX50_03261 [Emmonsia crescens]
MGKDQQRSDQSLLKFLPHFISPSPPDHNDETQCTSHDKDLTYLAPKLVAVNPSTKAARFRSKLAVKVAVIRTLSQVLNPSFRPTPVATCKGN